MLEYIGLGLSLYGMTQAGNASSESQHAQGQMTMEQGMTGVMSEHAKQEYLKEKQGLLTETYEQSKGIARDIFGNQLASLGRKTYGVRRESESTLSQTGLAFSGGVKEREDFTLGGINMEKDSMYDQYRKQMMTLDVQKKSKEADIGQALTQSELQMEYNKKLVGFGQKQILESYLP